MKLNGVLVALKADGDVKNGNVEFSSPGTTIAIEFLGEEANWRQNAEMVFALDPDHSVDYRGSYQCGAQ